MTRSGRRRLYLTGAILLVVALVGGRWLAVETAERAWDRTFTGGTTLIDARNLGLILQAFVLVFAVTWATGNLLIVYRAIGSVQMPRRLGDLEIVEAVSQRVLFGGTLLLGLVLGILFSLGTGDWWRYAALASSPPHFGIADNRIGLDAGYYVGRLPWLSALQNRALVLAAGMLAIVLLLYNVIGSVRLRRGRIRASNHARVHCGVLLAVLALVVTWGAVLDPAEVIAGVHGVVDQAALTVRIPGASVVAAVSILTAVISLAWAWRDRPTLIIAGWAALLVSIALGYFVIPGVVRTSGNEPAANSDFTRRQAAFERVAFGLTGIEERSPPAFPSGETAVRSIPVWDAAHVALAANAPITGVTLRSTKPGESATWLLAPTDTRAPLRLALETDTGLAVASLPTAEAVTAPLFGPGVPGPLVASPDSASGGGARARGIPITGAWRRFAIAWTIQDWSVLRAEMKDRALLWRRDVIERLERLAPFASFESPMPVLRGGNLWWVSWGYVSHDAFPYTRPLPKDDEMVRYLRVGLLGAVSVGTGETHLWLAPGYDSLTAAWARRFEPLIERAENLPPDLRAQVAYPAAAFETIVAQLQRSSDDSGGTATWSKRPREPFQLVAPTGEIWTGMAFEQGALGPRRFVGLCAGAMTARGLELYFWKPPSPEERLPGELVGSTMLRPGQLRIWPVGSTLLTVQAQVVDPFGAPPRPAYPPRIAEVYVSLDARSGRGPTARAALHGGEVVVTDTSVAARWDRARRLAVRADSALTAGDLELFGKLWRALMGELAPSPRPR